ncbi:MAG: right-handed parallel beta-helix repeat-containing protein, partial [Flavobacteriales bacterium]
MKNLLLSIIFITTISFTSFAVCSGPLSGNYTIDITSPTAGTNYQSFYNAISDLNSCGVSGPVVFNVKAGTYSGQYSIGNITGTTSTNTITFNGGTNGAIITHNATSSFAPYVFRLSGTKHIIFDSLTVQGTGVNYARLFYFTGISEHITIKNCILNCPNVNNGNAFNQVPISNDNNASNRGKNILIENNEILNAGIGILFVGRYSNREDSNTITGNTIHKFYRSGLEVYDQDNIVVTDNVIIAAQDPNYTSTGIITRGNHNKILRNSIQTNGIVTNVGISANGLTGTVSNPSEISNNMIVTSNIPTTAQQQGIGLSSASNTNVDNNTIHIRALGNEYSAGMRVDGLASGSNLNIRNNVLVNTGKGLAISLPDANDIGLFYNNLYYSNGTDKFKVLTTNYSSFSGYQAAYPRDTNSVYGYPQFVNDSNLHLIGNLANDMGTNLVSITTDIDGQSRPASGSTNIDIGADEFTPVSCVEPYFLFNYDRQSNAHGITWQTSGSETSWQIEYGLKGFVKGTGTVFIATNDSVVISSLTPDTEYEYYVRSICGAGDTSDWEGRGIFKTACLTIFNGSYTVNPSLPISSTNYHTLREVLLELENCGMNGAVTIDVASGSGPYVLDVDLNHISGNSHANSITLNGNGVTINKGVTDYFLALEGIKNMTINDFKFVNPSTSEDMKGILMRNLCDSIFITNNLIHVGTNTNASNTGCIIASGILANIESVGSNVSNLFILNNELIGGEYSISLNGKSSSERSENVLISNNTIRDFYEKGVAVVNFDKVEIDNNDVNRIERENVGEFWGLYISQSDELDITGNKIHHSNRHSSRIYGIYLTGCSYNSSDTGKIINNAIYEIGSNYQFSGIFMTGGSGNVYFDIHHNTIIYDFDKTSTSYPVYGFISYSTPAGIDFRNNIISISGAIAGSSYGAYFFYNHFSMTNDYNNIYVNSTIGNNYIGYYNGNRSTLSNWQFGTGDGANSLDVNPVIFKESYTPNFSLIDNKGNFTATHDVDSNLRSVSTPDMGAVEFSGVLGDIALLDVWIKEKNNCLVLDDTAYATIENVFENTIDFSTTPITVTWEITGPNNSTLSKTINSGTLLKGNELNVFVTPANMMDTGIYTLKAYLSLAAVNGKAFNDTITGNIFEKEDFKLALNSKNDTIRNIIDSVSNSASISYHSQPTFFFTEIAQYNSPSAGQPIGGRPSWLVGTEY